MKLFYCEVVNPRKACAVARYLELPVEFVRVDVFRGENKTPEFLALNPNGQVPVLQDGARTLPESNAIMCYLSDKAGADLWPHDARQIEILRWLSWDAQHFSRHAASFYFERVIKPFAGRQFDPAPLAAADGPFRTYAGVLDRHLRGRRYVVGERLSVADFALAAMLPYAERALLPLGEFPEIRRWHEQLLELPAWRAPFPPTREAVLLGGNLA
jgi:glutathione S-transferase